MRFFYSRPLVGKHYHQTLTQVFFLRAKKVRLRPIDDFIHILTTYPASTQSQLNHFYN